MTLCLVDVLPGGPELRLHLPALGGALCDTGPCWSAGTNRFNYKNLDKSKQYRPLFKFNLLGSARRGRLKVVAKRVRLGMIRTLPAAGTLVGRMVRSEADACWEIPFPTPSVNEIGEYIATTP